MSGKGDKWAEWLAKSRFGGDSGVRRQMLAQLTDILSADGFAVTTSISAIKAPTPADGKVEIIVNGWIRLSYRMPSTI